MGWHKKKKFECPYCEKSFNKKRQVENHILDSHECIECTCYNTLNADGVCVECTGSEFLQGDDVEPENIEEL
jgi:hypothetical protein